jgi:hypothetical protein
VSARRTQICAATSFLALSRSNSPFSKPPIRPEFLLRTSAPLRRNKRQLGNSRLQQIKRPRRRWRLRGTDGSNPPPSSGESTNFRFLSRRHPMFDRMKPTAGRRFAGCRADLGSRGRTSPNHRLVLRTGRHAAGSRRHRSQRLATDSRVLSALCLGDGRPSS